MQKKVKYDRLYTISYESKILISSAFLGAKHIAMFVNSKLSKRSRSVSSFFAPRVRAAFTTGPISRSNNY